MDKAGFDDLMATLERRFAAKPRRHEGIEWKAVRARLAESPDKVRSLFEMEATGGEPDVVGRDAATGKIVFADCSPESPSGRRSLCYDGAARAARKENKPVSSALETAAAMGVEVLTEEQYRELQTAEEFDRKTSSWLATPEAMRALGGALFGDRRYDRVFAYHNGADSYYAVRGFRGRLLV
jgi:hypothetical protein